MSDALDVGRRHLSKRSLDRWEAGCGDSRGSTVDSDLLQRDINGLGHPEVVVQRTARRGTRGNDGHHLGGDRHLHDAEAKCHAGQREARVDPGEELKWVGNDAGQLATYQVLPGAIQGWVGGAGSACNAIGADVSVVDKPPCGLQAGWSKYLALAEDGDFFSCREAGPALQGQGKLQGGGGVLTSDV